MGWLGRFETRVLDQRYGPRLDAPWIVGLGAAFDFHAGTSPGPPRWLNNGNGMALPACNEPRVFKRIRSIYILWVRGALSVVFGKTVVIGGRQEAKSVPLGGATKEGAEGRAGH